MNSHVGVRPGSCTKEDQRPVCVQKNLQGRAKLISKVRGLGPLLIFKGKNIFKRGLIAPFRFSLKKKKKKNTGFFLKGGWWGISVFCCRRGNMIKIAWRLLP